MEVLMRTRAASTVYTLLYHRLDHQELDRCSNSVLYPSICAKWYARSWSQRHLIARSFSKSVGAFSATSSTHLVHNNFQQAARLTFSMSLHTQALANTTVEISGDFEDHRADELRELVNKHGRQVTHWRDKNPHYVVQSKDGVDSKHISPRSLWRLIESRIEALSVAQSTNSTKQDGYANALSNFCMASFKFQLEKELERVPTWIEPVIAWNMTDLPNPIIEIRGLGIISSPISVREARCISKKGKPVADSAGGEAVQIDLELLKIHSPAWDTRLQKVTADMLSAMNLGQSVLRSVKLRGLEVVSKSFITTCPVSNFTLIVDIPCQRAAGIRQSVHEGWAWKATNPKPEFIVHFQLVRPGVLRELQSVKSGFYCSLIYDVDVDVPQPSRQAPIAAKEQARLKSCLTKWVEQQRDSETMSRTLIHTLGYYSSKVVPEPGKLPAGERFLLGELQKLCLQLNVTLNLGVIELQKFGRRRIDRHGDYGNFEANGEEKIVLVDFATTEGKQIGAGFEMGLDDFIDSEFFAGLAEDNDGEFESEGEEETDDSDSGNEDHSRKGRALRAWERDNPDWRGRDGDGRECTRWEAAIQNITQIWRRLVIVLTAPERRPDTESIGSLTMSEVEGSQPLAMRDPNIQSKPGDDAQNATADRPATKKRTSTSSAGSVKRRRKQKHHDGKRY
ncbi:hypothetical protein CLAFUW4_07821 [Fulvia fulva]|uniref:Uncharacterized protein n=1 Tax=Passalora fulva TaxID=5499 RepID=A0A9Q8LCS8_PASFU|nr:uncharacterized protein CLAFUR5_07945 [Fulvia fulva]KAK4629616.1 hypothetical protein CLAFUR4_07826 [Fulvia fulva]KAK4629921.1 hypothetical protein CLAFUR0_07823 [Fulvia fulva]UJO15026.1 hypothetical protein CLAFUR5_07945 [Fulvia fulva]WPV12726.1 hypothetical protein CLAFUW4_07821 [Fulvia fulva]WPV27082.1 hypothetical protein CLAFUW7_07822 [Fulvia fulva]